MLHINTYTPCTYLICYKNCLCISPKRLIELQCYSSAIGIIPLLFHILSQTPDSNSTKRESSSLEEIHC